LVLLLSWVVGACATTRGGEQPNAVPEPTAEARPGVALGAGLATAARMVEPNEQPPTSEDVAVEVEVDHILVAGQPVPMAEGVTVRTFADEGGMAFPKPVPGWRSHYANRKLGRTRVDTPRKLARAVRQVVIYADDASDSQAAFEQMMKDERSTHFLIDWDGTIYQPMDVLFAADNRQGDDRTIAIHLNNRLKNLRRWRNRNAPAYPRGHAALADGEPEAPFARRQSTTRRINGTRVKAWGYTDAQYDALVALLATLTTQFPNLPAELPHGPRGLVAENQMPTVADYAGIVGNYHWNSGAWSPGPGFDWRRVCEGLVEAGAREACPTPYADMPTTGPEAIERGGMTALVLHGDGVAELLTPDGTEQRVELPYTEDGVTPGLYRLWLNGVENAFVVSEGEVLRASVPLNPDDYDSIVVGGVRTKVGGGVRAAGLGAADSLESPKRSRRGIKRLYTPRMVNERPVAATLEATVPHVKQVLLHADITADSARARDVLVGRGLSTHFYIDWDGVLWQGVDPVYQALHAGHANSNSIGIDLNALGGDLYANPDRPMYSRRHPDYTRMMRPEFERPVSLPMRINRDQDEAPVQAYGYTEAQYRTLHQLLTVLLHMFPSVDAEFPLGADGRIVKHMMDVEEPFAGIVGHWHTSKNKWDPGPGFDWSRVCDNLRRDGIDGGECPVAERPAAPESEADACVYPVTYGG